MLIIYVDADACPVKPEIFRVAARYELDVILVANAWMRVPDDPRVRLEVVDQGMDVADDWIAEHVEALDIVITTDVPLASRCMEKEALVIRPSGKQFTDDNIGASVADRNLLTELRAEGTITGGPPPMKAQNRSLFLQQLDQAIQSIKRKQRRRPSA
ncbi:MAG: hypothetical protein ACI9OU_002184 [Candidatus Promineifilaceae bacterium]